MEKPHLFWGRKASPARYWRANRCARLVSDRSVSTVLGGSGEGGDIWESDKYVIVGDRNVAREHVEAIMKISKHIDNVHKKSLIVLWHASFVRSGMRMTSALKERRYGTHGTSVIDHRHFDFRHGMDHSKHHGMRGRARLDAGRLCASARNEKPGDFMALKGSV